MHAKRKLQTGLWTAAALCLVVAGPAWSADLEAGKKTFETVCAACHGPTGRPDPGNPTVQALDPQPADLSDPLFNSREAAADWNIVVTHGGPALGCRPRCPPRRARCRRRTSTTSWRTPRPLRRAATSTRPASSTSSCLSGPRRPFPRTRSSSRGRVTDTEEGDNVWRSVIEFEKRFGKRSMGVLEVIYEDDGTDAEITKVEAGAKTVLHWNLEKRSILSGALIVAFPPTATSPRRSSPTSPSASS